ncbi:MAG: tRNA (adenosine(37)-N6)-threonylcarbamoyltransferase complex dimerization subunit type 1 TsaB [Candidatus Margulisiibacteriota bacterium]
MVVLGISSATKIISAALVKDGKLLSEITVSGKEAFTENLILYIEKLVEESPEKIDGIAVAVGPGAYSGLRGGLACAKTLAQVRNLKLAAVSTLHALAYNLKDITGTIAAITDACRDDFNFALFRSNNNKIDRITDDMVLHFDRLTEVLGRVKGELHLTGTTEEIMAKVRELNPETKIVPARMNIVSGYNVALIGEDLIKEGKTEDPLKLIPKYSHTPNIREFKA